MSKIGELPQDTTAQDSGYIIYSEDGVHLYKITRADFLKNLSGFGLKFWKEDENVLFRQAFNGAQDVSKQYVDQAFMDYGGNSNYIFYGGRTKGSSTNIRPGDLPFNVTSDGIVSAANFVGQSGQMASIELEPTMEQGLKVGEVLVDGEIKELFAPGITPIYDEEDGITIANVEVDGVTIPIKCPVIEGSLEDMTTYEDLIESESKTHIGTISTPAGEYELYAPNDIVEQVLTTGVEIARVNGVSLYANPSAEVDVEPILTEGVKIAEINGEEIYAPAQSNYSCTNIYTASSTSQVTPINISNVEDFDMLLIFTTYYNTSSTYSDYKYPMPFLILKDALNITSGQVIYQDFTCPGFILAATMTLTISYNKTSKAMGIATKRAGSTVVYVDSVYAIKFS